MSNPRKRAAALYRNSDCQQENSIDRQKDAVRRLAEEHGYEIVAEYEFANIPGDAIAQHPDWSRLLRDANAGKWQYLLIDEPSRLNRDDYDDFVADVKRPLKQAGVKVHSKTKGLQDWNSISGDVQSLLDSYKSKEEVRDLSRRVMGTQALLAREGKHHARICPFGLRKKYYVDPETGKSDFVEWQLGPEEEVQAVRFIFDAIGNKRWSLRRVSRELEARAVKPPKGNGRGQNKAEGRWNYGTVRKIIRNRAYVGDLSWNETHQGKYSQWLGGDTGQVLQHETKNTRARRNRSEDVIIKCDVIPPIVDRELFARANAALEERQKETTSKEDENSYLFTRLLVCGDCGSPLRGCPVRGGKGYVCAKYKEYGKDACYRNAIREENVWKVLLDQVLNFILDPARLNAIDAEIERRLKAERADGTAERLEGEIDALNKQIEKAEGNLLLIDPKHLRGAEAKLDGMKAELTDKQAKLDELRTGVSEHKVILAEARKQLWRLREALEGNDRQLQAAVIREIISKVEVKHRHERTHGKKSKKGQGMLLSVPEKLRLYVRPGLGVSLLFTSRFQNQAHVCASEHANSCPLVCVIVG